MQDHPPEKGIDRLAAALGRLTAALAEQGVEGIVEPDPAFHLIEPGKMYTVARAESHTARRLHADHDADATPQEILTNEHELIRGLEAGTLPVIPGPHDPSGPAWQDHCQRSRAWRTATLERRDAGPKPEPPARPAVDHEAARQFLRREARSRRRRLEPIAREAFRSTRGVTVMPARPASRPRGAGRPRAQASRSSAKSGDGGSESDGPEPGEAGYGRFCGCGCGRSVPVGKGATHPTCRQRQKRERERLARIDYRQSWDRLPDEIQAIEDRIEELLLERQEKWRTAARDGGHRFLTTRLADELQASFAKRAALLARYAQDAHAAEPCPGHDEHRPRLVSDGHCLKCGRGVVASFGCRTTAEYSLPPARRTASTPGRWPTVRAA